MEPTDTQLRRDCLADIIMKVLEKPLSVEETHAILDKARGFGSESKAPAGKKPPGVESVTRGCAWRPTSSESIIAGRLMGG